MEGVGLQQYIVADGGGAVSGQVDMGSKDVFLKLLTAQMKYQDPLKPQDPTQMSSQLAQFNMVEQQISTNDLLARLADSLAGSSNMSGTDASIGTDASMYLGHTVVAESSQLYFDAAAGSVTAEIQTLSPASKAQVVIRDASGAQVRVLDVGALNAGSNEFTWDGTSDSGASVPNGIYSLEVVALDAQGNAMETTTSVTGVITAVQMDGVGNRVLLMGSLPIAYDAIREIRI